MELPEPLESTMKQLNKWKWPIITIYLFYIVAVVTVFRPGFWPDEFGFAEDESVTTTSEKDPQGTTTKRVETTKTDPSKTLWDWLSLLGAPITLAIFGYWLQQIQQERSEKSAIDQRKRDELIADEQRKRDELIAEQQRELAANETKEEVLQAYFDRLSTLLIDKNLMAIATKVNSGGTGIYAATPEEKQLVASAAYVVKASTLSILRRFKNDSERKTNVIRFLIEADFISKLSLNLSGADLIAADLSGAILSGAILSHAKLRGTNLIGADLSHAILSGAILSHAKLIAANLSHAELLRTNLSHAELLRTNLSHANLSEANLSHANLRSADLRSADLSHANLTGADLTNAILTGAKDFSPQQIKSAKNWEAATYNGKRLDDPEVITWLGLDAES